MAQSQIVLVYSVTWVSLLRCVVITVYCPVGVEGLRGSAGLQSAVWDCEELYLEPDI